MTVSPIRDNPVACWKSPSNIALVKYWGKKRGLVQIPTNTSVSLTLDRCYSETRLEFLPRRGKRQIIVEVNGKPNPAFRSKIKRWATRVRESFPQIIEYHLYIQTRNTFPHGSGIASSASGFSALACCLYEIYTQHFKIDKATDETLASSWARLGSGSACRSIIPQAALWGKHRSIKHSSDQHAIPVKLHTVFQEYQDTILLVDMGEKKVSSTRGHKLLNSHPFAPARHKQAQKNAFQMLKILSTGDIESFVKITESEALTLHALMMSGKSYYLLMRPNTIAIMKKVMEIREETGIPWAFTLDAGANVHLLYPKAYTEHAKSMIDRELVGFCENGQYICDNVGYGPQGIEL